MRRVSLKSLPAKIVLVFAALLTLLGLLYVHLLFTATRQHLQVVDQTLNRKLAQEVLKAHESSILAATAGQGAGLLFDRLMGINPNAEFYVLDAEGRILSYSAPRGRVTRDRVRLEPIEAFLTAEPQLPLLGDNPRDLVEDRVFSATPIIADGKRIGYIYAVLGGDAYRTAAAMFEGSHVLRISLMLTVGGLIATFLAGALACHLLARRLGSLTTDMMRFERSGFREPSLLPVKPASGDEIDSLARYYAAMSGRIAQLLAETERADESRRELVAHVTHDLRTPLGTLQVYLETLAMKWRDLAVDTRQTYLDAALKFSRRMEQITTDLFELATLDHRDAPLRRETFPLGELLLDIGHRFRPRAAEQGLALEVVAAAPGPMVNGDIRLIERLFANLIDNAIKFTPSGGRIRMSLGTENESVLVRVEDTGIGVPADEIDRIFERFHRVSGPPANVEGTGLGLAIARRIVELHEGNIDVASRLGAGSAFTVRLPHVT